MVIQRYLIANFEKCWIHNNFSPLRADPVILTNLSTFWEIVISSETLEERHARWLKSFSQEKNKKKNLLRHVHSEIADI